MTVGLLGGTGFLGLNLFLRLTEKGIACRLFSRRGAPNLEHHRLTAALAGASVVKGDLADPGAVAGFVGESQVVVFLVSHLLPSSSPEEVEACLSWFPGAFHHTLMSCARSGVKHFVFVSSGGTVYGEDERRIPFKEGHPLVPRSAYGALCALLEGLLVTCHGQHGLPYTILRLANVYGPLKRPSERQGLIEVVTSKSLSRTPIRIFGDGSEVRDYVYVEEAASHLREVIERPESNDVYNIGTGLGTTTTEVLESVWREFALSRPPVIWEPRRPCDVPYAVLDAGKLLSKFGLACKVGLVEGLQRYHAYMLETGMLDTVAGSRNRAGAGPIGSK